MHLRSVVMGRTVSAANAAIQIGRGSRAMEICHRVSIVVCLCVALATPAVSVAQSSAGLAGSKNHAEGVVPGLHDFDFLVGYWRVHHRKLKERLANNREWIEFDGTLASQPLMGGYANVDDDVFEVPGGTYRGVAPRSFDAKSGKWSIWWLDSRTPTAPLDPPVRGSFHNGVGTSTPTTPSMGNQSGFDSYGPRSPPRPAIGSKRSRPMGVRPGRRIGSRT